MYKESNDKKAAAVPGNDASTKHDAAFSDNTFWVSRKKAAERIIMGIDPGTNILGYGVLSVNGRQAKMVAMGVIDLRKVKDVYLKLGRIYERINSLIASFLPDELSIESPFFGKNAQSMLKLGRAQGVAIAAAINKDIPIHEYAPLKIKMAITGNGRASKQQVSAMLQRYLNIKEEILLPYFDATDALAAAYCHFLETSCKMYSTSAAGKIKVIDEAALMKHSSERHVSKNWKDFVASNPERVR